MAMLPNDYHPGPRCSCRECLSRFPEIDSGLTDNETYDNYSLTMQKIGGKTPAQEIGELKKQIADGAAFAPYDLAQRIRDRIDYCDNQIAMADAVGATEVDEYHEALIAEFELLLAGDSAAPVVSIASPPDTVIDLDADMWASVKSAIQNSPRFQEMYAAGGCFTDAISNVCTWLSESPTATKPIYGIPEVLAMLKERGEWLHKERDNGGDFSYFKACEEECGHVAEIIKDTSERLARAMAKVQP